MAEKARLHATAIGRVQGVFFRAFVARHACSLGLVGYARNLPSGRQVEVVAEGEGEKLEELLQHLHKGPSGARVDRVDVKWGEAQGEFSSFEVRH